jgi:hypothetical protein
VSEITVEESMSSKWGLAVNSRYPDHQTMRVEAGAVVDEYEMPGIGQVVARYNRTVTPDGVSWACMFTVVASGVGDLSLVHRLAAPTLAEARRCVRHAIEFMAARGLSAHLSGSRQPAEPPEAAPASADAPPWTADPRGNQPQPSVFALRGLPGLPGVSEPAPLS